MLVVAGVGVQRRQTRGGAGHGVGARTVPPEKPPPAPSHLGHPQLPSGGGLCRLAGAQAALAPEPGAAKRAAFLPAVFQSNWQVLCRRGLL